MPSFTSNGDGYGQNSLPVLGLVNFNIAYTNLSTHDGKLCAGIVFFNRL